MRVGSGIIAAAVFLQVPANAQVADEQLPADSATATEPFTPDPLVGWAVLEVRGGIQGSSVAGNATICLEVGLWKYIAVDACGSGGGFLYADDEPSEMVHFRVEGTIPIWRAERIEIMAQPGFGFAEIERGADNPGFLFGQAKSSTQQEGAGPEGALHAKMRWWTHEKVYSTAEVGGGLAYIPSAPVVLAQDSAVVPFFGASIGVGF